MFGIGREEPAQLPVATVQAPRKARATAATRPPQAGYN